MRKRKKQTVRLNNGEKCKVDREAATVEYKGKTIDLDSIVNIMIDIEQAGAVYTIRRDENKKIITRRL